jgi:hypothetical protein
MLGLIHGPEGRELAGESTAEGFQYAGKALVHGSGFGDDLADDELDAEAPLAAILLGNIAEDAADGDRARIFATAAEAGLNLDVFARGVL